MTMAFESSETIATQPHDDTKVQSTIEETDEEAHSNSDSDGLSTEPDSPVEKNDQLDRADEIPDGDSNADLHALLAYSKNRLEKQAEIEAASPTSEPAEITDDEVEGSTDYNGDGADDSIQRSNSEEEQLAIAKAKMAEAEAKAAADDDEMEALREEARRAQMLAAANDNIAEQDDNNPAHLLKLAEMKVRQAEEKARKDEEATGVNVIKPAVSTTKRSEANSELWALLNYSKVRLETGATPQLGKKKESSRGDDVSVSSKGTKSSRTSKKSIASRSIASGSKASASEVGVFDGSAQSDAAVKTDGDDVPFPDVTGEDNASVEGSVSGDDEQDSSNNDSDEDSEYESEEEEEDLPSFLKDDNEEEEAMDPAEQKRLYEEAKFKAASILSVDENLTEVQMLQAMAIAVEAANNGEDKFSTKRSLFKLNEAKLEDLKSFLDFSGMNNRTRVAEEENKAETTEREQVRWGIGRGRLMKKLGAAFQDLKERCDEIDERKQKERQGQLTHTEMFNAAFDDLKKQIDEYEKIIKSNK
jgi:hypothetical protein